MKLDYTIDFKNDYKNTILKELYDNNVDLSEIDEKDLNKLSLAFHTFQKNKIDEKNLDKDVSTDATYSSNMMIKWLNYLESEVKLSMKEVIENARSNNIKIKKFPLHFELQLDIENKSYQVIETSNEFNLNI